MADSVIAGSLKFTGSKMWFEMMDNGESIRICDSNRDNYFYVGQTMLSLSGTNTAKNNQTDSFMMGRLSYTSTGYSTYISSFGGMLGGTWYSVRSISVTSDATKKTDIAYESEIFEKMYDALTPRTFKFKDGTSGRTHHGFIAQEVKEALDKNGISTQDFAGLVINETGNGTIAWFLTYEEFISLNTWQIQKLKPRVATLEEKVETLETKVATLEAENAQLKAQLI